MLIGDSVILGGRTFVVVGFSPASVTPAEVQLSDPQTGGSFWLEMQLLRELNAPERAALRLVRADDQRSDEP